MTTYSACYFKIASSDVTDGYALTGIGIAWVADPVLSDVEGVGVAFHDNIWTAFGNHQYVFDRTICETQTVRFEAPDGTVGPESGDPPPSNTALLVKKLTGLRGRKNHGRMYVPGVLDRGVLDGKGVIGSTALTTYQTGFTAFLGDLAALTNVEHVTLNHNRHDVVDLPVPIVGLAVEAQTGTQRRRMRR